jgi:hypothetical protein
MRKTIQSDHLRIITHGRLVWHEARLTTTGALALEAPPPSLNESRAVAHRALPLDDLHIPTRHAAKVKASWSDFERARH